MTLFRTAVEMTSWEVHMLLNSHWRGPHFLNIVLEVADGLFGLCGSERLIRTSYL